ncbi:MAG TPA: DUF3859 domain-containing protein [Allosphingosinicella sp.]|nr:DUF3859 domain-containing protein [Allosphingosinicella sp.]
MMKLALVAVGLIGCATAAAAQAPQVRGIEIFEAGIYERGVSSSHRGADGVLQSDTQDERLVEATTRIPMRPGITFGISYRIAGSPEGEPVTVQRITRYPAPGGWPPGARTPLRETTSPQQVQVGGTSYSDYKLEEAWELIPGIWTIEIRLGDRVLASQRFTLVAPQQFARAGP